MVKSESCFVDFWSLFVANLSNGATHSIIIQNAINIQCYLFSLI